LPADAEAPRDDCVTVVIADDAEQVRDALSQLISADARFELRGVADGGFEAAALAERHLPELAIRR
jgi:DNA-binding NarL/FixJ family response regulator